jgi:hypothetical protein
VRDARLNLKLLRFPAAKPTLTLGSKTEMTSASADWHASNDTPAAATEARTLFRGTELVVAGSPDAPRAVKDERMDWCLDNAKPHFLANQYSIQNKSGFI